MPEVGIDAIGFYSSQYYLDLKTLAQKRGVDADKYYVGLGQHKMAVCPPGEDIVTMAANAAGMAMLTGTTRAIARAIAIQGSENTTSLSAWSRFEKPFATMIWPCLPRRLRKASSLTR